MKKPTPSLSRVRFRDHQVNFLRRILTQKAATSVHVSGLPATGKSLVISSVLDQLDEESGVCLIEIECLATPTKRLFFETFLEQIHEFTATEQPDKRATFDLGNFVSYLRDILEQTDAFHTLIVFLNNADRIRSFGANFWAALLKLEELCCPVRPETLSPEKNAVSVTILTESRLDWSLFECGTGVAPSVHVFFPAYTKEETLALLTDLKADLEIRENSEMSSLFENYAKFMVDVFWKATTELSELKFLVVTHWNEFVKPLEYGEIQAIEFRRLWKSFEPTLSQSFLSLHLNDVTHLCQSEEIEESRDQNSARMAVDSGSRDLEYGSRDLDLGSRELNSGSRGRDLNSGSRDLNSGPRDLNSGSRDLNSGSRDFGTRSRGPHRDREMMELPLFSKYLILAGYLASHNPPKSDKRYFVKWQAKGRKQAKPSQADIKFSEQCKAHGPRPFSLGRLRAIFLRIIDSPLIAESEVDMALNSLEQLGLLVRTQQSNEPLLVGAVKWRCAATEDFVKKLAQNVEFDLRAYLFSF